MGARRSRPRPTQEIYPRPRCRVSNNTADKYGKAPKVSRPGIGKATTYN